MNTKKLVTLFIIMLMVMLPVVSAVEISEVVVRDVTETGATVEWLTDEEADSAVDYGLDKENFSNEMNEEEVLEHSVALVGLDSGSDYYFKVMSGDAEDDNSGDFYSFKTLEGEVVEEEGFKLEIEVPEYLAEEEVDLTGVASVGSKVKLYLDGLLEGIVTVSEEGTFEFLEVDLTRNEWNTLLFLAKSGEEEISKEFKVFVDLKAPQISLIGEVPEFLLEAELAIKGKIGEEAQVVVLLNEQEVYNNKTSEFLVDLTLVEGENTLLISAEDLAGNKEFVERTILLDMSAPEVSFDFEKGMEYYQGNAETQIFGQTEAGAKLYLYYFKQTASGKDPDFSRAFGEATADENGSFVFDEVDLDHPPTFTLLEKLGPKQVPQELLEVEISSYEGADQQENWITYVYVIAEDKAGRVGYAEKTIQIHSCFSGELKFNVMPLTEFQLPRRLDPDLLDDGRQVVTMVLDLDYLGQGQPLTDANGNIISEGFEISDINFRKACTHGMIDDESTALACKILPETPQKKVPNANKDAWFVQYTLNSAEDFSEKEDDFWNDFKKRQVVFPIKAEISYRERLAPGQQGYNSNQYGGQQSPYSQYSQYSGSGSSLYGGSSYGSAYGSNYGNNVYGSQLYGPLKTQTVCLNPGYFVDIPIDSEDLIPDWLADDGVRILNNTIETIDTINEYLYDAMVIAGVTCGASFILRMAARWYRLFQQKWEPYLSEAEKLAAAVGVTTGEKGQCPLDQGGLFADDTIANWKKLQNSDHADKQTANFPENLDDLSLNLKLNCPKTASAWKIEDGIDQVFKYSCYRVFCKAAPARWTEDKTETKVQATILKGQSCGGTTGKGLPLQKLENCDKEFTYMSTSLGLKGIQQTGTENLRDCWKGPNGVIYFYFKQKNTNVDERNKGIYHLTPLDHITGSFGDIPADDLVVYQPKGSDNYIVGVDDTCNNLCKRTPGFEALKKGQGLTKACKLEKKDGSIEVNTGEFTAGYTKDCFINEKTKTLQQCICVGAEEKQETYAARTALRADGNNVEEWSYRQDRIFQESNEQQGTYYPKWRYYGGRDFPASFGLNHLLDYTRPDNEEIAEVNPNTQHIGAVQSLCISGVYNRLKLLRDTLDYVAQCITDAKHNSINDAGICKHLMSQYVCGLVYKIIAYAAKGCLPITFSDEESKGSFDKLGKGIELGIGSLYETVDTSFEDLKSEFGNAKLNEFVSGGVEGFTRSVCMAALGYDWVFDMDFLMDAAYATPFKTTALVIPERELVSYDPTQKSAIYSYSLGASLFPGCDIRSWNVKLKCVGPEDMGKPGVDCTQQGCDCAKISGASPFSYDRERIMEGGTGFDVSAGGYASLPVPSPQIITSQYRYDHVVVELMLEQYADPSTCFDEGYFTGNVGRFYFPVVEVGSEPSVDCNVDLETGRFICSGLSEFFSTGAGYFEWPFVDCANQESGGYVACNSPNGIIKGDPLIIRPHITTDGTQDLCMYMTLNGGPQSITKVGKIPKLNVGSISPTYSFSPSLDNSWFVGGLGENIFLDQGTSNLGCNDALAKEKTGDPIKSNGVFSVSFTGGSIAGTFKVKVGATVETPGYTKSEELLINPANSGQDFNVNQINQIPFVVGGYKIKNILKSTFVGPNGKCTWKTQSANTPGMQTTGTKTLTLSMELRYPGLGGSCELGVTTKIPGSQFGVTGHQQPIVIQESKISLVSQDVQETYDYFLAGSYADTFTRAINMVQGNEGGEKEIHAYYLAVAARVLQGANQAENTNPKAYKDEVVGLITQFANENYGPEIKGRNDYKKIAAYMKEIGNAFGVSGDILSKI